LNNRLYSLFISSVIAGFCQIVSPAFATNPQNNCPIVGAEYIPHPSEKIRENLNFVLRIEKASPGGAIRNLYLNFDAYNEAGEKVSTMRFSDALSNGDTRQSFSTYWGQFCDFDEKKPCANFGPYAHFNPIGVNEDLSQSAIDNSTRAPPLLIFPGSHWELKYNSFQSPEHWDKYIRFYTKDRIYPDFRGVDFWIRKKCGGTKRDSK
jgi:hypothetical protein